MRPQGEVRGLRVRNAAGIDLSWRDGVLSRATLRSDKGGDYSIAYRDDTLAVTLAAGETAVLALDRHGLVRA